MKKLLTSVVFILTGDFFTSNVQDCRRFFHKYVVLYIFGVFRQSVSQSTGTGEVFRKKLTCVVVVEQSMWNHLEVSVGVSYWSTCRAFRAEVDWNRPWCGMMPASEQVKQQATCVLQRGAGATEASGECVVYQPRWHRQLPAGCRSLPRRPGPSQPKHPAEPPRRLRAPHPSPCYSPINLPPPLPPPRQPSLQM